MPDAIDQATYAELCDSAGADFAADLVGTFCEEAPIMFDALRLAREQADGDGFRRAAHSIKSNCATFGALGVAGLARTLELAGLAADATADQAAINALWLAYESAATRLRELARG